MRISCNWLRDYIECDLSAEQIAEALTSIGLEVDSLEQVEAIPGGLAGVIVAEVVECYDHPDSDHLHITRLNTGEPELLQVVCGAPNVAAGQKVLLATVGTKLGEDFKIKKSKIRGVESFGMICAEDELGIGNSHDGIMVLDPDADGGQFIADAVRCRPVLRGLGLHAHLEQHLHQRRHQVAATARRCGLLVAQPQNIEHITAERRNERRQIGRRDALLPLGKLIDDTHPVEERRDDHR